MHIYHIVFVIKCIAVLSWLPVLGDCSGLCGIFLQDSLAIPWMFNHICSLFFFFKSGSSSISNSLKNFLLFIGWIPKFLAEGTRHLHAEKLAQVAILISHRPLTRNLFSSRRKHCSRIHSGYFHFIYLCMGFFSIWKVSFLCPWNFPASFSRFKMRSVTSGKFLWPPEVELDVSFLFTAKARSFYL